MNLTEYFLNNIKLDSHYEKHVAKDATSFTLTPDRKGYIKLPPMTKEEYNNLANNILKISNDDKDILYSYTSNNSTDDVKNYVKIKLWLDDLIIDKIDEIFEDRLDEEKKKINSNEKLSEEEKKVIISNVEKKLSWDPNDYCEYTAFGKSVRNGKEVNLTYYLIPKMRALTNFKSQKSSKQVVIVTKEVSTNKSIQVLKTKEDNITLRPNPTVINDDEKIYNYEIIGEKEYVDKFLEKIKQYVISIQDKEEETNNESLNEELLLEKRRSELIQKGKQGASYKDQSKGRNRWERKRLSRVATTVAQYNRIDMNTFFKKDELIVNVPVQGETDNYLVTIKFSGVLEKVRELLKNGGKFEFRIIANALTQVFNTGDIKIHCTCLHPDTKINLLDGTIPTVKELKERFDNGEELWVYSTDENGDFKPGKVSNVFITKKTTKFIRIYLDNDKYIDTTPDHLYLKRDGNYIEAQDLQVGDSLMPNHSVVKIEYITLEEPIEVYDITVDKYSNFLVDSSVILHNCADFRYRFGYWLTRNNDDAGPYENRPSDKTNPHDTLGSGCKHILLVLSNMNWLMKVASVINNYIHYAEIRMPRNYNDYIFPALYGYTQTSLFRNTSKGLGTSQQTLNRANKMGRTRGQYKTGNVPHNKGTSTRPQPGQMQLDLDYDDDKNEPIFRNN